MRIDMAKNSEDIRKQTLYNSTTVILFQWWNKLWNKSRILPVGNKEGISYWKTIQIKLKKTNKSRQKPLAISPCKINSHLLFKALKKKKPLAVGGAQILRRLFFLTATTIHCVAKSTVPRHLCSCLCSIWYLTLLIRATFWKVFLPSLGFVFHWHHPCPLLHFLPDFTPRGPPKF